MASSEPAFLLVPVNDRAQKAVLEEANGQYWFPLEDGTCALNISFAETSEVTLGSGGTHIYLPDNDGAGISRKHCSFTYERDTGAVVLHDKSRKHNTEVFDIEEDRVVSISRPAYSVVVSKGFNRRIAVGHKKYYQFELKWQEDVVHEFLRSGGRNTTFGPWGCKEYRYVKGEDLGAGAFGAVWKAVDIRNGKAMAVKRFHTLEGRRRIYAHREISTLLKISNHNSIKHDHILELYDTEYDPREKWIEMFMPLKEGSLKDLGRMPDIHVDTVANAVLYQMLLALKCTASHDIVHRDLKPDNILYETRYAEDGTPYFHFWLADFGLSHDAAEARTKAGTEPFMAPEVAKKGKQTPKMDVWSLFATLMWLWNVKNFRRDCWQRDHIHQWLVDMSKMPKFATIAKMARTDPSKRYSAKDLLAASETFNIPDDPVDETPDEPLTSAMGQMTLGDGQQQFDPSYSYAEPSYPNQPYAGGAYPQPAEPQRAQAQQYPAGQYPTGGGQYPAGQYPAGGGQYQGGKYPAEPLAQGEGYPAEYPNYAYQAGEAPAAGGAQPRVAYQPQYGEQYDYSPGRMGRDYNDPSGFAAEQQQPTYHQSGRVKDTAKQKGKERSSRR